MTLRWPTRSRRVQNLEALSAPPATSWVFIHQSAFHITNIKQSKRSKNGTVLTLGTNCLFVDLLRLNHALLLGPLLGNLAVVVRLSRAGCGEVRGDLGLDGVDNAAALVLLDGLKWNI